MGIMPVMPRLAKVRAIKQKTPIGATLSMMSIMVIITVLNCSKNRFTVSTLLPRRPSTNPRMSAKKMI